jgi:hypothetical protein
MLVTDYRKYRYAQAGNVRFLHLRNGVSVHESKDMSLAAALADKGEAPVDTVSEHIERHNLSCYLGQRPEKFYPYVSGKSKLEDGDVLALYTRGIWEKLSALDLSEAADGKSDPTDLTNTVEEIILAPDDEPTENYSFASIFVDKVYENAENRKKLIKKILMIAIPVFVILLAVGITLFVRHHMRQTNLSEMNNAWEDAKVAAETGNFTRAAEKADEAYTISQKLNLAEERSDLMDLIILFAHITAGDEALSDKKYDEALFEFRAAGKKSYQTDLIAADYITARMNTSADYVELIDLIDRGDAALDKEDYEAAKDFFSQAVALAAALRAGDEKSLARDGLSRTREAETVKSTADMKDLAQSHERRGDENPELAAEQYALAAELYRQAGDSSAEKLVIDKADRIKSEEAEQEKTMALAMAQASEMNGDIAFSSQNYALARDFYLAAQSAYTEQCLVELSQIVGQKLLRVLQAEQPEDAIKETE